jgi:hypothetical protein
MEKAFKCRWCGEMFSNPSRLTLHSHSKHPEKWSEDESDLGPSGPPPTLPSKPSSGETAAAPKPKSKKSFVEWLWDGDDDEGDE